MAVLFTAISTEPGTQSILKYLLNDRSSLFCYPSFPLLQILPLFNVDPTVTATFLKPPQILFCTWWGTNQYIRESRYNK